jgi:adenosine deaminase
MFIRSIPKVELHVHLEACIDDWLITKLHGPQAANAFRRVRRAIDEAIPYDFGTFVKIFRSLASFVRSIDDLSILLEHALRRQKRENVVYTEFTFTPSFYKMRFGWSVDDIVNRFIPVLACWNKREIHRGAILLDISDDTDIKTVNEIISCVHRFGQHGIVGINYSSNEKVPIKDELIAALSHARERDLNLSIHLGEFTPAEECIAILERIHPHRIGHGVRLADTNESLKYLRDTGIAVELCLTSNLLSGAITRIIDCPIQRFVEHGVSVSINTDDPVIFAIDITSEYEKYLSHRLVTVQQLRKINIDALASAFFSTKNA